MDAFSQVIQIISAIAVGGSAVVVAVVAVRGLNQWRAQLKGNAEYDLARRLLRAILSVRDTVNYYRSPMTYSGESADRQHEEHERPEEARILNEEFARRKRLMEVRKVMSDLQQAALEAEVLWGGSVSETLEPFSKCVREIFVDHEMYFSGALERARGRDIDAEFHRQTRNTVYWMGASDKYSKRLESAVETAQDAFRGYLK